MLRGRSSKAMGVALWLTLAVVSTVAPARAQSFSQGKALTLIVGNTPGSGYDTYGRLVARYMFGIGPLARARLP